MLGAAGAGALPARRNSSHPPACCSDPEILLQIAFAGLSPIAEKEHRRSGCETKTQLPGPITRWDNIWGSGFPSSPPLPQGRLSFKLGHFEATSSDHCSEPRRQPPFFICICIYPLSPSLLFPVFPVTPTPGLFSSPPQIITLQHHVTYRPLPSLVPTTLTTTFA